MRNTEIGEKMTKKQRKTLGRIVFSAALLFAAYLVQEPVIKLLLFLTTYVLIGFDVIKKSVRNIANGKVFDENFLMMIATFGAIVLKEYGEAVFVMLFYQVGELFQSIAVGKSRASVQTLLQMAPDTAWLEKNGETVEIFPEDINIGDVVIVKPGEKIPVDGVVVGGESDIDAANMTGESCPVFTKAGDSVVSGCISLNGLLKIRAEKQFSESTVSKILELVENASDKKTKPEQFISRFAKYYTPLVVGASVMFAIVPSIISGDWQIWLYRALMLLVISCPCALVISVPLGFFGGIGCASKNGVLIKGSNYIEALSNCGVAVFDKTGTLTKGKFSVEKVFAVGCSDKELIEIAAYAEAYSNHPVSAAIKEKYGKELDKSRVTDSREFPGMGASAVFDRKHILSGNSELMRQNGIVFIQNNSVGTVVYIATDGKFSGSIVLCDEIKEDAGKSLEKLKGLGVSELILLSGDKNEAAKRVGKALGFDRVFSELLPQEKVEKLEEVIAVKEKNKTVLYAGDGVNDAPVLMRADIGVSMGVLGSDSAIEAADVVVMDDNLKKIPFAIALSKHTMQIVKQNIFFALAVKFLVMALGIFGFANMWGAVFADVGVSVIAILNSMRTLMFKR